MQLDVVSVCKTGNMLSADIEVQAGDRGLQEAPAIGARESVGPDADGYHAEDFEEDRIREGQDVDGVLRVNSCIQI